MSTLGVYPWDEPLAKETRIEEAEALRWRTEVERAGQYGQILKGSTRAAAPLAKRRTVGDALKPVLNEYGW